MILGLTITSSWGNGHATTYRGLMRALVCRGHSVLFLERDKPWYASHRDLPVPPFGTTILYDDLETLTSRWGVSIATADLVIVGSYVPDGIALGHLVQRLARGVTAFYDIDTPVTLEALNRGACDYLSRDLIHNYDLYLSFTGGPTLVELEESWGAVKALPLYCSADAEMYQPQEVESCAWDLGYLGTYSLDRQDKLDQFFCYPACCWSAGRFAVAGALYPSELRWPANVIRMEHLPPAAHREFYATQRFTLNVTRKDMVQRGWSPSVRLFEAASCGTPIISDWWEGIDSLFRPGEEIIIVRDGRDVVEALRAMSDAKRRQIGAAARARVVGSHTADHRAAELEAHVIQAMQVARKKATA